jgi:hypothetical protein
VKCSQLFDPFAVVQFTDLVGARRADPPLPGPVRELAAYLDSESDELGGVLATPAKVREVILALTADLPDREVSIGEASGVIALKLGDVGWPVVLCRPAAIDCRVCLVCGCTPDLRCRRGCSLVTDTLCSACVARLAIGGAADGVRRA